MREPDFKNQADLLAQYIVRRPIDSTKIYELYEYVISSGLNNEEKLTSYAFAHSWSLPYLDAALVFVRPDSELRRRIYVMFAILEATPEYSDDFLPKRFTLFDTVTVILSGLRAVFRIVIGLIILKVGRL